MGEVIVMPKKMEKKAKELLAKGFRLLQQGASAGERLTNEGDATIVAKHIDDMLEFVLEMKKGIRQHMSAQTTLDLIEHNRPNGAAKIGRPKLRLVK